METASFDIHRYVQQLTDAGLAPSVAQIIGDREAEKSEKSLATKDDITQEFKRLEVKIETIKSDLTKVIKDSQLKIIGTLGGLMVAFGVVIAIAKLI